VDWGVCCGVENGIACGDLILVGFNLGCCGDEGKGGSSGENRSNKDDDDDDDDRSNNDDDDDDDDDDIVIAGV
jgi:hypothetical protein